MFCNKGSWSTVQSTPSESHLASESPDLWQPLLPSPNITQRWSNTSALSPISVVTHCTSHQLVISLPNTIPAVLRWPLTAHSQKTHHKWALIQLPSSKTKANLTLDSVLLTRARASDSCHPLTLKLDKPTVTHVYWCHRSALYSIIKGIILRDGKIVQLCVLEQTGAFHRFENYGMFAWHRFRLNTQSNLVLDSYIWIVFKEICKILQDHFKKPHKIDNTLSSCKTLLNVLLSN